MTTTTLYVPTIECDGCAASIRNILARTPGVGEVDVNVDAKTVTVAHDGSVKTTLDALDAAGFPATGNDMPSVPAS